MGRDRSQQATPDLFSTASSGEPSPPAKQVLSTHEGRHVLPKDLPNAVKHLNDRELDLLITASLEEAKRRGRLPPSVQAIHQKIRHGSCRHEWPNLPLGGNWKWQRFC